MKLVIIKNPKNSCKLSNTTRPAKKFSQIGGADKIYTNALYSETRKTDFFMKQRLYEMQK